MMWQIKGEASIGVSGYTNTSYFFEGAASTSVYTLMLEESLKINK